MKNVTITRARKVLNGNQAYFVNVLWVGNNPYEVMDMEEHEDVFNLYLEDTEGSPLVIHVNIPKMLERLEKEGYTTGFFDTEEAGVMGTTIVEVDSRELWNDLSDNEKLHHVLPEVSACFNI